MIDERRADEIGNVQYRLTQRNFGPIMARAARVTIVELDEPIVPAGGIDPDAVHTPSIFTDRLVVIPEGQVKEVKNQR